DAEHVTLTVHLDMTKLARHVRPPIAPPTDAVPRRPTVYQTPPAFQVNFGRGGARQSLAAGIGEFRIPIRAGRATRHPPPPSRDPERGGARARAPSHRTRPERGGTTSRARTPAVADLRLQPARRARGRGDSGRKPSLVLAPILRAVAGARSPPELKLRR